MQTAPKRVSDVGRDRGATATEYAMLVGFIAVVVAVGITTFGQNLNGWYAALADTLADLMP